MSKVVVGRRDFLQSAAIGAAAAATTATASSQDVKGANLDVVDFHNHYIGPSFKITAPANSPQQELVNRNLASPAALIDSLELAGVKSRVIKTPTAFLEDADGKVPADISPRINDELANLVTKTPGKLHALASIDAWSGDAGARAVTRAVKDLGLRGVYIESAKGGAAAKCTAGTTHVGHCRSPWRSGLHSSPD